MSNLFLELYTKYAKPLLKFILKKYRCELHVAEEIAQETWLAAMKSYHTFKNKSTFFTWLCKIAIFKSADYYRKYIHEKSVLVSPSLDSLNSFICPNLSLEEQETLEDLRSRVRAGLNLLPENYKRALVLRYYYEFSYDQIAVAMNISTRAVDGVLSRARKKLSSNIRL